MVTEGPAEADSVVFVLDGVLIGVVDIFYYLSKRIFEGGEVVCGLLEEAIGVFAVEVPQVVDVDNEARPVLLQHSQDVISVVVHLRFLRQEVLEDP